MADEKRAVTPGSDLGFTHGLNVEYVDPHLKTQRDYGSDYAKLAMQGGHKDLLYMDDGHEEQDYDRKQKSCDEDNLSNYNRVAKQGGHKDLLSMGAGGEDPNNAAPRKQRGCENVSDYNRLALQGGHKDLLVIAENKPSANRVSFERSGGDWFSHNNNVSPPKQMKPTSETKPQVPPLGSISDEEDEEDQSKDAKTAVAKNPQKTYQSAAGALPGGDEQVSRFGKKRFEQGSQRREAPFATNW